MIVATADEICASAALAPSTCPAVDGTTCIFPFLDSECASYYGCFLLLTIKDGTSYSACQSQGEEFWCRTNMSSGGSACEKTKCPLNGSLEAPSQEAQQTGGLENKEFSWFILAFDFSMSAKTTRCKLTIYFLEYPIPALLQLFCDGRGKQQLLSSSVTKKRHMAISREPKWLKGSKIVKNRQNCQKWSKMVQNCFKWSKMVQNGDKRSKWSKMV